MVQKNKDLVKESLEERNEIIKQMIEAITEQSLNVLSKFSIGSSEDKSDETPHFDFKAIFKATEEDILSTINSEAEISGNPWVSRENLEKNVTRTLRRFPITFKKSIFNMILHSHYILMNSNGDITTKDCYEKYTGFFRRFRDSYIGIIL